MFSKTKQNDHMEKAFKLIVYIREYTQSQTTAVAIIDEDLYGDFTVSLN
jgi:hypothetical protein